MLAATGVIWAAVYMLWMLQRVLFGKITNPENAELPDLNAREIGLLVPLMILMLFMGVYPRVFLDRSKASVVSIRDRVPVSSAGGSYTTSVQPLCTLCLRGEINLSPINHRDTEHTEVGQRRIQE